MLGLKIFRSKIFFGPKQFWGKKMLQKSIIEQKMIFIGIIVHNLKIGTKIYERKENDTYRHIST